MSTIISMKKRLLLLVLLAISSAVSAQMLQKHLWEDRVILLFASNQEQSLLKKELHLLTLSSAEVTERDLLIYQIFPGGGIPPDGGLIGAPEVRTLYDSYDVAQAEAFTFILIGKDGTVKLRENSLVKTARLFALIDQMPMRRAEMRRQDRNSSNGSQH